MLDEDLTTIPDEDVLLRSNNSLGHGIMNEIHDIVYVKTDHYSASNNQNIAWEIEKINQQFLNEGKNYVLVGPGRWGSSDTWVGYSGEVATYFCRACHCGGRYLLTIGRSQSGNTFLPEPDFFWCGIFHD